MDGSSEVERGAVNADAVGSIPTRPAKLKGKIAKWK